MKIFKIIFICYSIWKFNTLKILKDIENPQKKSIERVDFKSYK